MKAYPSEENGRAMVAGKGRKVDEKTWRKWTREFVSSISFLECEVVRV